MRLESVDTAITVQSSHIDLGDGLPAYARESIVRVASKYFGRLNTASVHFSREGITYRCSVNMQMGGLPMKTAEAMDKDIYLSFDAALVKVAKQLRRSKRELREDKAERVGKEAVLRERINSASDADEDLFGPDGSMCEWSQHFRKDRHRADRSAIRRVCALCSGGGLSDNLASAAVLFRSGLSIYEARCRLRNIDAKVLC